MRWLQIRVAELSIMIQYRYDYFEKQCEKWLEQIDTPADFQITVTDEEINEEYTRYPEGTVTRDICESACIYREIAKQLGDYSAFVMHGAVLEMDKKAYLFAARSGVGKTTHTKLWVQHFKGKASYINGDKPILRKMNGTWYAFGTPWMGKEQYGTTKSAPIQAICFLERGELNEIDSINSKEVIERIFCQLFMPKTKIAMLQFMDLVEDLVSKIPFYVLKCTISEEAVELAYNTMKKDR